MTFKKEYPRPGRLPAGRRPNFHTFALQIGLEERLFFELSVAAHNIVNSTWLS